MCDNTDGDDDDDEEDDKDSSSADFCSAISTLNADAETEDADAETGNCSDGGINPYGLQLEASDELKAAAICGSTVSITESRN